VKSCEILRIFKYREKVREKWKETQLLNCSNKFSRAHFRVILLLSFTIYLKSEITSISALSLFYSGYWDLNLTL